MGSMQDHRIAGRANDHDVIDFDNQLERQEFPGGRVLEL